MVILTTIINLFAFAYQMIDYIKLNYSFSLHYQLFSALHFIGGLWLYTKDVVPLMGY